MALVRERNTGSVVNVPDDKVDQIVALGYYERVASGSKTTAKKAAASKPPSK